MTSFVIRIKIRGNKNFYRRMLKKIFQKERKEKIVLVIYNLALQQLHKNR